MYVMVYLYILGCLYLYIYKPIQFGGFNPSDKYEFVSWDDEIPNGKIKARFQTTNQ